MPGRGAEFWIWASHEDVMRLDVFKAYLENLKDMTERNIRLNEKTGGHLATAKKFGLAAPVFAFIVAVIAYFAA